MIGVIRYGNQKTIFRSSWRLTDIVNHVAFGNDRYILTRNGKELVVKQRF